MHLCLTVECITSGLHLSVFLIRSHPPPNRWPNLADLADLFCRIVGFLNFADLFCRFVGFLNFADLFCRFVGASGILGHLIWRCQPKMCSFTLGR